MDPIQQSDTGQVSSNPASELAVEPAEVPTEGQPEAPTAQVAQPEQAIPDSDEAQAPVPYANWRYFGLRTLLLLTVGGALYLLGVRGLLLLVLAFLGSGIISIFALARQRNAAAGNLEEAVHKINRKIERRAAAEDDDNSEPPAAATGNPSSVAS